MKIYRNIVNFNIIYRIRDIVNHGGDMYKYRVDDTTTKKALESFYQGMGNNKTGIDTIDKLVDGINDINNSLQSESIDMIEKPEFKRLEDIDINDDKIKMDAEESLKDYRDKSIDKIYEDSSVELDKLNFDKKSLKENYDSTISRLDKYYDEARQRVSNDAISRGLARSSIVINNINAFTDEQLATYSKLDAELTDNINALDFEISSLESEKEKALSEFDVEYATKLNTTIEKLKQDLMDRQTEITKYNNEISKLESDFDLKYKDLEKELSDADWSKKKDLMEIIGKYGSNIVDRYKENQVVSLVDQFFKGRSKEEIRYEIKYNVYLKDALGKYYDKVLSKYE